MGGRGKGAKSLKQQNISKFSERLTRQSVNKKPEMDIGVNGSVESETHPVDN